MFLTDIQHYIFVFFNLIAVWQKKKITIHVVFTVFSVRIWTNCDHVDNQKHI